MLEKARFVLAIVLTLFVSFPVAVAAYFVSAVFIGIGMGFTLLKSDIEALGVAADILKANRKGKE